jgi:hypothetical protein
MDIPMDDWLTLTEMPAALGLRDAAGLRRLYRVGGMLRAVRQDRLESDGHRRAVVETDFEAGRDGAAARVDYRITALRGDPLL